MSTALRPDGQPVVVEGVTIVSPGLRGQVDVLVSDDPGKRSADSVLDVLVQALDITGMQEQRTIVVRDHSTDSTYLDSGISRSTQFGEPGLSITVPGPGSGMGQVLLAVDEAGVVSWVLPDDVPADEAITRGTDSRTYTIAIYIAVAPDDGRRGLLAAVGKKVLKVLAFKLLDRVAQALANTFAARWEAQAHPYRLRPFGLSDYQSRESPALSSADLAGYAGAPCLLFIHGELSLSHSCFRSLPADVFQELHNRYGGRVLAFDHPTVSVTPTANAAWLAEQVRGAGLTCDVIAHSRGGRVLTEWPEAAGLVPGSLDVRRLVMVATPNQGTALADADRLGALVERITNLMELIPDNAVIDVLTIVISVVKQIAVGAYKGLDGLTAMIPGGEWLAELNTDRPADATYHTVSSSYEPPPGSPLTLIARDRVSDLVFHRAGNDLMVPEAGVHASNGARLFPVAEPLTLTDVQSVDHSGYWTAPAVHATLHRWLSP